MIELSDKTEGKLDYININSTDDIYKLKNILKNPTIIKGAMENWPAIQRWNWTYLLNNFGNRKVLVEVQQEAAVPVDLVEAIFDKREVTIAEVIDGILNHKFSPRLYLAMSPILTIIPELIKDLPSSLNLWSGQIEDVMFWLGPTGTISPVHFDESDNFLAQILGIKKIIFIEPKYSHCLYPYKEKDKYIYSPVDLEQPDFIRFPKLVEIQSRVCIIEPGEMIFIPKGHWHFVRALESSISLNFWQWRNRKLI